MLGRATGSFIARADSGCCPARLLHLHNSGGSYTSSTEPRWACTEQVITLEDIGLTAEKNIYMYDIYSSLLFIVCCSFFVYIVKWMCIGHDGIITLIVNLVRPHLKHISV